jgi:hypothetical protein
MALCACRSVTPTIQAIRSIDGRTDVPSSLANPAMTAA